MLRIGAVSARRRDPNAAHAHSPLSTSTIATGEVSTLNHKGLDDAVEGGALVAKALLSGRESPDVESRVSQSCGSRMITEQKRT